MCVCVYVRIYGLFMAYMYHLHMTQIHRHWAMDQISRVSFRSLAQGLSLAVSPQPTSWKRLFRDVSGLRLFIASHLLAFLFFSVSIYLRISGLCSCIHCTRVESSAQRRVRRVRRVRRGVDRGRRLAQRPSRRAAGPRCTWHRSAEPAEGLGNHRVPAISDSIPERY